ncbi:MAG: pentapeptide repeat-containing protein [Parcubacteria group bacterium]|nr:pentapeptide repeat-containing protein [Parcubacteria group bacterium]
MANPKHIALVLEGKAAVDAWNTANPGGKLDLTAANLSGMNLMFMEWGGADLSGANLSGSDLSGASLWRTKCVWTNFSGADLSGVAFSNSDLSYADLTEAILKGAFFNGATMEEADLEGTFLDPNVWFEILGTQWDAADRELREEVIDLLDDPRHISNPSWKNLSQSPDGVMGNDFPQGQASFTGFTHAWYGHAVTAQQVLNELWARRESDLRELGHESCPQI